MKNYSCKGIFIILSVFGVALVLVTWNDMQPYALLLNVQRFDVAETDTLSRTVPNIDVTTDKGTLEKAKCLLGTGLNNVDKMCENISSQEIMSDGSVKFNLHLDLNHNISYCQIQKVGSTFIRKMFSLLDSRSNASKTQEGKLTRLSNILSKQPMDEIEQRMHRSMKMMFIRNPYGRAFSGYIDKLYAPNPAYWQQTGLFITKNIRWSNQKCGHNVTFPEFLKYLSFSQRTMTGRDRHFYPMFDHCNPCKIKYNFVGRMESFKNDVMCLLDRWNDKYGSNITFSDFEKENDVRMAHSQISRLFGMRDGIEKCITLHEALRRVWKVLQIRGIIPILSNFTFSVEDSVQMKQQDWKNVLTNVIENIPNRQSVKSQRSEALAEAFNLVDPLDIQTYTETYDNDFSLLGYDKTPPSLKHTRKDRPNSLLYFRDMFR